MYMRTTKSGGHEYVSLAHNERDPKTGQSRANILYKFGRKDQLDAGELKRLIASISRFLDPEDIETLRDEGSMDRVFEFLGAKRIGVTHVLDGVWQRLGLTDAFERLLEERAFRTPIERLLFALVAQRAVNPGSKLSVESWVADEAHIEGLDVVDVQQLYRAMDFLLGAHDEIQREVFWSVSNLFNLEVDVLFVDTTSTFFEIEGEDDVMGDEGDEGDEAGEDGLGSEDGIEDLRRRGHSKDSRPDLAQAVIGFAVTRDGIPVRCWVWPGNTVDVKMVDEVKRDLNTWKLGRVVMVMDTGFNSEQNRKTLQGAGDAYILGERMRLGANGTLPEALKRPGRYKVLDSGLRIKEVTLNQGSVTARRFVVVHNPEQAERDRAKRDDIVRETEQRLADLAQLDGTAHTRTACDLRAHRTFGRYIRQTKTGKLKLDKSKIQQEAKLDGKYLVSTSDDHLPAEDVVMGYKQLHEIERVNRDLKHTVDVRPVYHRRSDRIKAHVLLCWLALLLIRISENETGRTWHQLKDILRPLSVAYHQTEHGRIAQTNAPTKPQKNVLDALKLKAPQRFMEIPTPERAA
jgi:transposase